MTSKARDTQVNFKTDHETWQAAKAVFAEKHLDATQGFNLFLDYVATRKELPFQTEDEARRERLADELVARVRHNSAEIDRGEFVTLEEARKRLLG